MTTVTHEAAYMAAREVLNGWPSSIKKVDAYITQQRTREAEQQAEIARLRAQLRRFLPVLERLEDMPSIWAELTAGTGIATLNSYRAALNTEGAKG